MNAHTPKDLMLQIFDIHKNGFFLVQKTFFLYLKQIIFLSKCKFLD